MEEWMKDASHFPKRGGEEGAWGEVAEGASGGDGWGA